MEVVTEDAELKPVEARAKYRSAPAADWPAEPDDVTVMDSLPGAPDQPLFRGYAELFAVVQHWLPQAASAPDRVGLRKLRPGVWVGLHSRVSSDAELRGPCWIGENVLVGPRAIVGPAAIVENGTVLAAEPSPAPEEVRQQTVQASTRRAGKYLL